MPVWLALPAVDHRRVYRPQGKGSYAIDIEPYRGSRTWFSFLEHLEQCAAVKELNDSISKHQPELAGHLVLPGQAVHLGDSKSLVSTWCRALESYDEKVSADQSIEALLDEFSALLDRKSLTQRIITSVAGLQLPSEDFAVSLGSGVTLRSMTVSELSELSSQDIAFGHGHDIMSHSVSSCIEVVGAAPFSFEPSPSPNLLTSSFEHEANAYVADIFRALHTLKPGRASVFVTTSEFVPQLLPRMGRGASWPLTRPPFASFDLGAEDVVALAELLRAIRGGIRDEVRIAADRLVDAETRLSPVDALLDAAIGLEALLNPMDVAELAFRVALNYAYLSTAEFRRERYERVRTIQKTRNRVVHGGLNLRSPDAAIIHEHAKLAKACLRDTVRCFLLDPSLAGNRRLDAEFWLDRILPANVVAEQSLPPQ